MQWSDRRSGRNSFVAAIVAAALLAGCATQSAVPQIDPHRYTELTPGTSTKDEAIARLGTPQSISAMPAGASLLQWIDNYSAAPIHVAIMFGADGRMIRVEHVFSQ
jgi:hypothetical protein